MLHNDAAQQRPGNRPASAPEASQNPPRAQGRANSKIPTLQRMNSRPGDTTAAGLTAGNMDTSHISLIHGRPSPPPRWDSTPHAPTPTLQEELDPTKNERYKYKRITQVAYGEGHEQAGRRSPPPQWDPTPHTTTPTLQQAHDPTKNAKLKYKHLARPALYHSLGEGHEQTRSARVEQGIGQVQQPRLTSKDRKKIPAPYSCMSHSCIAYIMWCVPHSCVSHSCITYIGCRVYHLTHESHVACRVCLILASCHMQSVWCALCASLRAWRLACLIHE